MPIFELKALEAIVGKQKFFYILIDGINQYEEFTNEIQSNPQYVSEQKTILSYMNWVANLQGLLPKTKFREITPAKDKVKEYEFKSDHLRAYIFHIEKTGKVIAYWGYKNNQASDIKRFRSIKKMYLNTL